MFAVCSEFMCAAGMHENSSVHCTVSVQAMCSEFMYTVCVYEFMCVVHSELMCAACHIQ